MKELLEQINAELNAESGGPDPNEIRLDILSVLRQINPSSDGKFVVWVDYKDLFISDLIKALKIEFSNHAEPVITYNDGNYVGIGWECLTGKGVLPIKERLSDILQYILKEVKLRKERDANKKPVSKEAKAMHTDWEANQMKKADREIRLAKIQAMGERAGMGQAEIDRIKAKINP